MRDQDYGLATQYSELLWYAVPGLATAGFLRSRLKTIAEKLGYPPKRVKILRSYTTETVAPLIEVYGLLSRFQLSIDLGQYNTYLQELMTPDAIAANEVPDVTLIALHTRTAAPALWNGADPNEIANSSSWLVDSLQKALHHYRSVVATPIIVQLLDYPPAPPAVAQGDDGRDDRFAEIKRANDGLRAIAGEIPDCHVFDVNTLIEQEGAGRWHDERNWSLAKVPFRNEFSAPLALAWYQHLRPALGAPYKVLVTDLDHTLWGGVLGEDGPAGLLMSADGAGAPFRKIQESLVSLKQRGFLLAIASKNDEHSALSVLDDHPDCLLKRADFVTMRINWEPKSDNIRSMADELSLGLDSFVFLDDNPTERAEVSLQLPQVRIFPYDTKLETAARLLTAHPDLQRLHITAEDRVRTDLYRNLKDQRKALNSAPSRDEFLVSLDQVITLEDLGDTTFVRMAELEKKTNQFNLRTRRFSETDLRAFHASDQAIVLAFRVQDRFGDNGVIGSAVVTIAGPVASVDNFLMSCRVIGRDVETAMLAVIARVAREKRCERLVGSYAPTAKNKPAADFYGKRGFKLRISEFTEGDGAIEIWEREIDSLLLHAPRTIRLNSSCPST